MYMLLAYIKKCTIAYLSPEEGIRTMKLKLYAIAGSHMGTGN